MGPKDQEKTTFGSNLCQIQSNLNMILLSRDDLNLSSTVHSDHVQAEQTKRNLHPNRNREGQTSALAAWSGKQHKQKQGQKYMRQKKKEKCQQKKRVVESKIVLHTVDSRVKKDALYTMRSVSRSGL